MCYWGFFVKLRCFYRVYKPEILVFSYPLLALKPRSSTCTKVGAIMLPPKFYLVVFYQVILVNRTKIFVRTSEDLQKCFWEVLVVLYHMFIPPWGNYNKFSSMIVFVKEDPVSYTLFVNPINAGCFFPWLLLVVE